MAGRLLFPMIAIISERFCRMTDDAPINEAVAVNAKMISTLLVIYRVAHRALSAEERVGQQIQQNPRAEIEGLLIQMMAIEKLALGGLPKEGHELLDLALAEEETAVTGAEGRKAH
jgi:hypothetical protein